MAELLKWTEATPDAAAGLPHGLSDKAAGLDPWAIWLRIESWTGFRWSDRGFVAIVEWPGDRTPPVAPVSAMTAEVWQGGEWLATELFTAPLGLELGHATYRITGTAGGGLAAAPDVLEAYRRLAEYTADLATEPAAISYTYDVGEVSVNYRRERAAMTSAIQNSGAADLLRPYRRAK